MVPGRVDETGQDGSVFAVTHRLPGHLVGLASRVTSRGSTLLSRGGRRSSEATRHGRRAAARFAFGRLRDAGW